MSMSRRLAVVATALGTVAAGLFTGATVSTANASSATSAAAPGQTVEVFVKRDHIVVMPTEIRPGVSKFVVSSRRAAGFQIVQAAPGYTKAEAMRDINARSPEQHAGAAPVRGQHHAARWHAEHA